MPAQVNSHDTVAFGERARVVPDDLTAESPPMHEHDRRTGALVGVMQGRPSAANRKGITASYRCARGKTRREHASSRSGQPPSPGDTRARGDVARCRNGRCARVREAHANTPVKQGETKAEPHARDSCPSSRAVVTSVQPRRLLPEISPVPRSSEKDLPPVIRPYEHAPPASACVGDGQSPAALEHELPAVGRPVRRRPSLSGRRRPLPGRAGRTGAA